MNTSHRISVVILLTTILLGAAGCLELDSHQNKAPASPVMTQADMGYYNEELRRLNARLDSTDAEIGRLYSELANLRSSSGNMVRADQIQAVETRISDLQRQITTLDAARTQDKRDIYDDITQKVTTIINTANANRAPAKSKKSESGWEHVVQSGESLSAIAKAYNVKVASIMEANNIKNANTIRAGQKLFIPD